MNRLGNRGKNRIMFNNTLLDIFKLILKHRPEWKSKIVGSHKQYLEAKKGQLSDYIEDVLIRLEPHIMYIAQFDENIFSDDYGDLELIPGLDIKSFWNTEYPEQTKERFWNYFQKLYLAGRLYLDPLVNRDPKIRILVENLQLDRIVKDSVEHDEKVNPEVETPSLMEVSETIQNLLGDNSIFAELSKEIVQELPDSLKNATNPLDMITSLFGGDGQLLQNVVQKVTKHIADKMESGELSREKLFQSAQAMTEKLGKSIQGVEMLAQTLLPNEQAQFSKEAFDSMIQSMKELDNCSEVRNELKDELKDELKGEVRNEVKDEVRNVVKDGIKDELKDENIPRVSDIPQVSVLNTEAELLAIKNVIRSRRAQRNKEI